MTGEICWKKYKQVIDGASENTAVWEEFFLPSRLVRWEAVVKQPFLSENSTAFLFNSHICFSKASFFSLSKMEWFSSGGQPTENVSLLQC
jgi:hypothetical protein